MDDFEHDSTTPSKKESQKNDTSSHKHESSHRHDRSGDEEDYDSCADSDCDGRHESVKDEIGGSIFSSIVDAIFDPIFDAIFDTAVEPTFRGIGRFFSYGTSVTMARTYYAETKPGISRRKTGSPLLPTFRVQGTWQSVYPDVQGRDFSIEAGFSVFGIQYRHTSFVESNPHDDLALSYGLASYRLSYGNSLELDLGYGVAKLKGDKSTNGDAFAIPVTWKLANHFAVRLWQAYPTFNSVHLTDLDLSFMYEDKGLSAVVGYRSVTNPVSKLSGPYIGMSYCY